jgi:hypothetical protein
MQGSVAAHLVVLEKILAGQCDQLLFGWMIDDLVGSDLFGRLRPVFFDVVSKVRSRGMRSDDQDFADTLDGAADFAEKFVLRANYAAMLRCVMRMRANPARLHVFGVKLQDLCGLVVSPDHGVCKTHIQNSYLRKVGKPAAGGGRRRPWPGV